MKYSTTQLITLDNGNLSDDDEDDPESDYTSAVMAPSDAAASRWLSGMYKRRFTNKLSTPKESLPSGFKPCDPAHETNLVTSDEVSITIAGLATDLTPESVFSGIYGIIPPPNAWRPQGHLVQFFQVPLAAQQPFYLRDQLVPSSPALNKLGINYHGNLKITSDRLAVMTHGRDYQQYKVCLSQATDAGFHTMPELAVQLALDICTDSLSGGSTLGHVLKPTRSHSGEDYRNAFQRAWKVTDPDVLDPSTLWPYVGASGDENLIKELGKVAWKVAEHVMSILHHSGAFTSITEHAKSLLLNAPARDTSVPHPGLDRLRRGLQVLWGVGEDAVVMHEYAYSYPQVIWDDDTQRFITGVPAECIEHLEGGCLCWVGPYMAEAFNAWKADHRDEVSEPSQQALWRAYMRSMEGVVDMHDPPPPAPPPRSPDPTVPDTSSTEANMGACFITCIFAANF